MIADLDIYGAATLIVDKQGDEAAAYTAARADQCLEEGELKGTAVWRAITVVIEELQRDPLAGLLLNPVTSDARPHVPRGPAGQSSRDSRVLEQHESVARRVA
jgi:hypothetical protein